ncbi:Ig-like domain-containing protein [Candidatus Enterococcus mansonii]|uniref:BIG2 domain-containing protein n=1 Tax=Candidatus Enterococcus mansonii TaxID=1834181 RepID=A0A242CCK2_9ENTE|nr:Ig-like domain-containing protein [Enterococcus sp. 4G2_DIV0659]OTO07848.1 hypothetical protein A5880_002118 [Enterococcus sp. 4G2_DIV0659]
MRKTIKKWTTLFGGIITLVILPTNVIAVDLPKEIEYFPSDPTSALQIEIPNDIPETRLFNEQRKQFPEKFDYTVGNFETVMKNQGELGLCWAYSGTDTIGISAKKEFGEEYYISPNYFNYYFSKNAFSDILNPHNVGGTLNDGGSASRIFIQGALNNLGVSENTLPTPMWLDLNKPMISTDFYNKTKDKLPIDIEKTIIIPGVSYLAEEVDHKKKIMAIKELVYTYGASTFYYDTEYSHDSTYYNYKTNATYVPIEDAKAGLVPTYDGWLSANHGITIVGWDDTYAKENFVKKPKNNGAFKMKNSWGVFPHDRGYFYMSYEDAYLLAAENIAADTSKEKFDHVNSYITGEMNSYMDLKSDSKDIYAGNVYTTSKNKEVLEAVSISTDQPHLSYEIYYLDKAVQKNKTFSGFEGLEKIASGIKDASGIERIQTKKISLKPESEYSIIVKYTYPRDVSLFRINLQKVKDASKGQTPHLEAGRSFFSNMNVSGSRHWLSLSDGSLWGENERFNTWINVYTRNVIENLDIAISPKSAELIVGDSKKLDALITPENATNKQVNWSSSNTAIATVSENGDVTGISAGEVIITAQTAVGYKKATAKIRIIPKKVAVTDITVPPSTIQLKLKEVKQLTAVVKPENATNKKITWSSSDPSIATVSGNGEITGQALGKVTIIAQTEDGHKESRCIVEVTQDETDDHGDTGETATKIIEGAIVKGKINSETDIDVFEMPLPEGPDKTVVLESPNGQAEKFSIQNGAGTWFHQFKGTKEPKIPNQPFRTMYNSDKPKDKLIRFYIDKSFEKVGGTYEFKITVLHKGQKLSDY